MAGVIQLRRPEPDALRREMNVVGMGMLYAPAWVDLAQLEPSDFYHPQLRAVFEAQLELRKASKPVDRFTVAEQMRALDTLPKLAAFGGESYLFDLTLEVADPTSIAWYVGEIIKASRDRQLHGALVSTITLDQDDMVGAAKAAVERYQARAVVSEGLPVVRACDVPDPGNTRWLIKDIWIAGGVGFIAGEPKTKKSFLSLEMAISVASGHKMLSRFEVPQQGSVVLFNAEDRPTETRRRLERMCTARSIRLDSLSIYIIDVPGLRLTDAAQMRALDATIAKLRPALCVFDPFRNLFDGDEDKSDAVTGALNPLRMLQRRHETAVAVVHHMTKPSELKRRAGQRMRGSGALHGWGDSNLYVDLKGDVSCVEVEQRYADAPEPFGWQLRDMQTADGFALWCDPCAVPSTQKQTEETKKAGASSDEMILLNTIRAAGGPISANALEEALPMNRKSMLAAIKSLAATGTIQQVPYEIVAKNNRKMTIPGWVERGTAR